MGIELILFSYAVGLIPILFGLVVLISGRVRVTLWSVEPLKGLEARMVGLATILMAVPYYAVISWAWSIDDR
jgi:hypothetical protein